MALLAQSVREPGNCLSNCILHVRLCAISGRHRWPRQFSSTAVKVSIKAAGHAYAAG
jgi:hypothetical protein